MLMKVFTYYPRPGAGAYNKDFNYEFQSYLTWHGAIGRDGGQQDYLSVVEILFSKCRPSNITSFTSVRHLRGPCTLSKQAGLQIDLQDFDFETRHSMLIQNELIGGHLAFH